MRMCRVAASLAWCSRTAAARQRRPCVLPTPSQLPIRFNVTDCGTTLVDQVVNAQMALRRSQLRPEPTCQDVQRFSTQCLRLVHLCLFTLIALYDHCADTGVVNGSNPQSRFHFALLLLTDHRAMTSWCRSFFATHKVDVCDDQKFQQLSTSVLTPAIARPAKVVFLFDEVHVLFGKCCGFLLHDSFNDGTTRLDASKVVAEWQREQDHGQPATGHNACTDLFHQFRLVMLSYLTQARVPLDFVMCSTVLRVCKVLEEDEQRSLLHRGAIEQFFNLHWFTHPDIKQAVLSFFSIPEAYVDALELAADGSPVAPHMRLSTFSRPLFLMEFLEQLYVSFATLPDSAPATMQAWLRAALTSSQQIIMTRAREQISRLVVDNVAVDVHSSRLVVHQLYTAQRLCGGTLELGSTPDDQQTLENFIAKGVARIDTKASRFRISDPLFTEALVNRYATLAEQHEAVMKVLTLNSNFNVALVSHDSAAKGFLLERVLAWLTLSGQLNVTMHDAPVAAPGDTVTTWAVKAEADTAGTIAEFNLGNTTAQEPAVLQSIMRGARYVLLPTTLAGPDLWMRATIDGVVCMLALQSKAENVVHTMKRFRTALSSLDPVKMYGCPSAVAARTQWLPMLAELELQPYHRVVFSACGFTAEVQHYVREYNLSHGHEAPAGQQRFIHLLTLDDIRAQIGSLHAMLQHQFQLSTPIQATMAHECLRWPENGSPCPCLPRRRSPSRSCKPSAITAGSR